MRASRIGFGCAAIGGYDYGPVDDEVSLRAVEAAFDAGVTLFDVADIYGLGHAECILAKGLGRRRKEVVIATKFGVRWDAQTRHTFKDISSGYARKALEASLRRLRLDCIPLYQVHWPDGTTPIEDVLEELDRCRKAGKLRAIGMCNFDPHKDGGAIAEFDVNTIQLPFSLIDSCHRAAFDYGRNRLGVRTLAYNVLAHGFLSGKYAPDSTFTGSDLRTRKNSFLQGDADANWRVVELLKAAADRLGVTPAQIAIRWALNQSSVDCVLVGAKDVAQSRQNANAINMTLPVDIAAALDEAAKGLAGRGYAKPSHAQ
ncbi:MAG: aldo/keto reductase [Elusimicrobia bacterium]|nr:aldo/keto reductase [Elusimicrobiota bacterium]